MAVSSAQLKALEEANKAGRNAVVRKLCEDILRDAADTACVWMIYAENLMSFASYDEACQALNRAASLMSSEELAWVYCMKGDIYKMRGNFPRAARFYLKAHKLNKEEASFLIYAASIVFRSGDLPKALLLITKATACSKGCIEEAYHNLGCYHLAEKSFHKARAA
ncbi:MAG: hypothetical protein HRT88_15465, partial [Lentisphaeraceae bacterium]|nr:hypothetical protein [Lentisphaeraceae bacterium]